MNYVLHWYYFYASTHKVASLMCTDPTNTIRMVISMDEGRHLYYSSITNTEDGNPLYLPNNWIYV